MPWDIVGVKIYSHMFSTSPRY